MKLIHCQEHVDIANDIIKHESIFNTIADDYGKESIGLDLASILLNSNCLVLNPRKDCLFLLVPSTLTLYEVHTMIKESARGINAIEATLEAATWVFNNTKCEKIITHVPSFDRPAKIFALKCGMKLIGNNTKSFLKDNILHDQWLLGLEKERFLSCQQFR